MSLQSWDLFTKFSLLWEVLPFFGHYPLWKYLLKNICKRARAVWDKYEKAFRERSKTAVMKLMKIDIIEERMLKYLENPEVSLNHKIWVDFTTEATTVDVVNKFKEFLLKAKK